MYHLVVNSRDVQSYVGEYTRDLPIIGNSGGVTRMSSYLEGEALQVKVEPNGERKFKCKPTRNHEFLKAML